MKASCYQSLIGSLWWIVELGRGDTCVEVSGMAYVMSFPLEGHLNAVLQIFSFLNVKHNGVALFDPTDPDIKKLRFQLKIGLQHLMLPSRRMFLLMLLHLEARASLWELIVITIMIETQLLVAQWLTLLHSLTMLLSFVFWRKGEFRDVKFWFWVHSNEILLCVSNVFSTSLECLEFQLSIYPVWLEIINLFYPTRQNLIVLKKK